MAFDDTSPSQYGEGGPLLDFQKANSIFATGSAVQWVMSSQENLLNPKP